MCKPGGENCYVICKKSFTFHNFLHVKNAFSAKIVYILQLFTCKKAVFIAKTVYLLQFFTCREHKLSSAENQALLSNARRSCRPLGAYVDHKALL